MGKKPLQVYLDDRDRKLLEEIAEREGLSLADALRVSIRRCAESVAQEDDPILRLIGTIDDPTLPPDWSINDEYSIAALEAETRREEQPGMKTASDTE